MPGLQPGVGKAATLPSPPRSALPDARAPRHSLGREGTRTEPPSATSGRVRAKQCGPGVLKRHSPVKGQVLSPLTPTAGLP